MLRPADYANALSQSDDRAQAVIDGDLSLLFANAAFNNRFLTSSVDGQSLTDIFDDVTPLEAVFQQGLESSQTQILKIADTAYAVDCRSLTIDNQRCMALTLLGRPSMPLKALASQSERSTASSCWSADFHLSVGVIRAVDVPPMLMNVIMQLQAPHHHQQRIYMVLAELFNNALEHGLLGLDSRVKNSVSGFEEYYRQRELRLAHLQSGFVRISLQHQPADEGGDLHIRVEDSGPGFDTETLLNDTLLDERLSGRGSEIILKLCRVFYYTHHGRVAHVIYRWTPDAD